MQHLVEGPVQVNELLAATPPDCGASLLFSGVVRNHHQGRSVTGIRYHAYRPLAEAALAELEEACRHRFELGSCRIVHGLGELGVSQVSVAILTTSAHRDSCYQANRWAIDTLKQTVPIWKEERFTDGDSAWVDGVTIQTVPQDAE